jgi:hypothetical protein
MGFVVRIEGFGKIEHYNVELTTLVQEVKQRFCDAYKLDRSTVVPFVNSRRLLESHTLDEAHVTDAIPIKMYDMEMARFILNEHKAEPKMKLETASVPMALGVRPYAAAGLRAWTPDKPKGFLGLF